MALTKITKIGSNGLDDDVSAGGGGLSSTDSICLLYTSPSPRDAHESRMPSSA